jgi:hypothetical protein
VRVQVLQARLLVAVAVAVAERVSVPERVLAAPRSPVRQVLAWVQRLAMLRPVLRPPGRRRRPSIS